MTRHPHTTHIADKMTVDCYVLIIPPPNRGAAAMVQASKSTSNILQSAHTHSHTHPHTTSYNLIHTLTHTLTHTLAHTLTHLHTPPHTLTHPHITSYTPSFHKLSSNDRNIFTLPEQSCPPHSKPTKNTKAVSSHYQYTPLHILFLTIWLPEE